MTRTARSFNRAHPHLKPQPLVLVICEDTKSSKTYLQDAANYYRVKVTVTHCGNTDPRGIVRQALACASDYNAIFCVIDRDTHETFDEALTEAKKAQKINIIPSYPCFEYWLLIHFKYTRKPYAATGNKSAGDLVMEDLKKYPSMNGYEKGGTHGLFDSLLGKPYETAHDHARKCIKDAEQCGEFNPSTRIHDLLDFFARISTPENNKNTYAKISKQSK